MRAHSTPTKLTAGSFSAHVDDIAKQWISLANHGRTVAISASTNDHADALNDAAQRMRLTIGELPPEGAVPIAGGELAYVGDVIATRRNARDLRTSSGEPVRNRDLWTATATHPDRGLTVSHLGGHGTITLPADYVQHHVRLGYAATEHGHQGDTVDVGITLVSSATTHRGLYVGATRGRDDNRIHVVTETTDIADARDVLECVLAHDRADIPAVTQRRELDGQIPLHHPERGVPTSILPDWVASWRTQLEEQRDDLAGDLADRAARRAAAATELAELQPALDAARAAWQPYADRITAIEDDVQKQLRPAMWKANHDATRAGFGHRHGASRRAQEAAGRVDDAHARIAAISSDGAEVERHLGVLEAQAQDLDDLAHPTPAGYSLEQFNREQLDQTVGLLDAVDIWTTWACGKPVRTAGLATAVSTLTTPPNTHPCSPSRTVRSTAPGGSMRSSRSPNCSGQASNSPAALRPEPLHSGTHGNVRCWR